MYFSKFSVYISLVLKYMLLVLVEIAICERESPCPAVFRYNYDSDLMIYGILKIPFPKTYSRTLLLKVELLIENEVSEEDLQNKITYLGTADDIIQKKPLFFRLEFPFWETFYSQIMTIFIDDELLCISDYINLSETNNQTLSMENLYFTIPTFDNSENVNLNIEKNVEQDFQNHDQTISQSEYFYYADSSFGNSIPFEREPVMEQVLEEQETLEKDEFSDCGLSAAPERNNEDDLNLLRKHPWVGGLYEEISPLTKNNYRNDPILQDNFTFICPLSLITSTCALTTFGCVTFHIYTPVLYAIFGKNNMLARLNSMDQTRKITEIYIYPDYDKKTRTGNIAILSFDRKVKFTNYVRPVCLWLFDSNLDKVLNIVGTVIGLQTQFFPLIASTESCQKSDKYLGFLTPYPDTIICAEYGDAYPCRDDVGSGLYINIEGRWFIRGILNTYVKNQHGKCANKQYYHHMDVAKYINWITKILYQENFNYFYKNWVI